VLPSEPSRPDKVMKRGVIRQSKGVTLIELLIALVISAILIAGIYRTFIQQQRSYATQEQVADMQQNVRVAINRMIREVRMAGFGGKNENTGGTNDIINIFSNVNGFVNIINPVDNAPRADNVGNSDEITVVGAFERFGRLDQNANAGDPTITILYDDAGKKFDTGTRMYLCIAGRDNYVVTGEAGNVLTINPTLRREYRVRDGSGVLIQPDTPVFLVRAIQYGLRVDGKGVPVLFRDQNTGGGRQSVAEYIEDLQFRYVLADTTEVDVPANPQDVRGVRISIRARTEMSDSQLKEGGGFRRRTLNSYVDLRNMRD
jgi:prepilin-type N-terminal cleavage/methylation domain-containing protein